MINKYSIRNIFTNNNSFNYSNYRRIKFNFEKIEEELGKIVLPGLKKFKSKKDPIRFMVYLYEGYHSQKSELLSSYEMKYPSRELNIEEKKLLVEFMKKNENNRKIMGEFLSSCQILIDYIQKENYNNNYLLSNIIKELPYYIQLNEQFKKFFEQINNDINKINTQFFTVNTLLSIFKLFEHFCWKEMKENINLQYKEKIDDNKKKEIISYFKEYNKFKDKLISKRDLAGALRRFISRYLVGKRSDTEVDEKQKLIKQIIRNDLWELYIIQNENKFQVEIYSLTFDLNVNQAFEYYEILGEDELNIKDIDLIEENINNEK